MDNAIIIVLMVGAVTIAYIVGYNTGKADGSMRLLDLSAYIDKLKEIMSADVTENPSDYAKGYDRGISDCLSLMERTLNRWQDE